MKQRKVEFSQAAEEDLLVIYDWIAKTAGEKIADAYVERLEKHYQGFDIASRRGVSHEEIHSGLRVVGFEKRVTIAFLVREDCVVSARLFYGGQDWKEKI